MNFLESKFMSRMGLALIVMSSVLVGIWAVKDTIALRNILLVLGVLCSLPFLYQYFKNSRSSKSNLNYLPIACMALALIWVVFHYCFLSISPVVQFRELTSIWLRSALALLLGLATGIALIQRPRYMILFWLTILSSFLILIWQYLPLAWAAKNLVVPLEVEDFRRYLFIGKINPMYIGILLISGSTGLLLDALHQRDAHWIKWTSILWFVSLFMAMYSFAFIINTRSGIFLGSLVMVACSIYVIAWLLHRQHGASILSRSGARKYIYILILALILIGIFAYQQVQRDAGWRQLIEDIQVGYQIEKYPQWQNVGIYGFPKNESGNVVAYNTYERVAWATAGVKSIPNHPFGVGILLLPLGLAAKELFPAVEPLSTHSGWVDLTLSFGLPMLFFMWLANFSIFIEAIRKKSTLKYSVIILSAVIFALFTIGELSNGHNLEMLFYFFALMAGTQVAQNNVSAACAANIAD